MTEKSEKIKHILESKTFWINLLIAVSSLVADIQGYLSTTDAATITTISIVNVVLRSITNSAVRLK